PDVVLLIDTSQSMGEPDAYRDDKIRERAKVLGEKVQKLVEAHLPARLQALDKEIETLRPQVEKNPALKSRIEELEKRKQYYQNQKAQISQPSWRATRLQLVQSLLSHADTDWIEHLVQQRKMKVHIYRLNAEGDAIPLLDEKGAAGEINDNTE